MATKKKTTATSKQRKYKGNIDLDKRKVYKHPAGYIQTEHSMTIGSPKQGFVNIPTIVGGKPVSGGKAVDHYRKTGKHLGKYKDVKSAVNSAKKVSKRQNTVYNDRIKAKDKSKSPFWD
jgi:hypothetical protein